MPRHLSGPAQETWKDAGDMPQDSVGEGDGPVFVITLGGREVPFADRRHSQDVAGRWNDDCDDGLAVLRADGCEEERLVRPWPYRTAFAGVTPNGRAPGRDGRPPPA